MPTPSTFRGASVNGPISGYFHHLDSTGLYYAQTQDDLRKVSSLRRVPLHEVQSLGLRKRGSVGKGIGIGILAGIGTAIVAGQLTGKPSRECGSSFLSLGPCSRGDMTTLYILPSTLLGTLIGGSIGGGRRTITFGGHSNRLKDQEAILQKFAYPH
ncbi:hypothetical protein [Lewinella sp. W8]|uniref:hypothetical protein n=1 Tax=Lewinella sp. W8 TaxID=2528208 RepID=UPI001067CBE1|nr:hypothetical protein [Lewinella sp. W8]MTB51033.1 hypothetical protein [Lewinella sp. W8]